MEFSRPEYRSGLPFSSPGNLPDPGIELPSPAVQANSLPSELINAYKLIKHERTQVGVWLKEEGFIKNGIISSGNKL